MQLRQMKRFRTMTPIWSHRMWETRNWSNEPSRTEYGERDTVTRPCTMDRNPKNFEGDDTMLYCKLLHSNARPAQDSHRLETTARHRAPPTGIHTNACPLAPPGTAGSTNAALGWGNRGSKPPTHHSDANACRTQHNEQHATQRRHQADAIRSRTGCPSGQRQGSPHT